MPQENRKTVYLAGKLFWVKILGAPRPNFDGDAREWTFEFEPNEESVATLTELGVADRLRDGKKKDGTIRKGYENRKPFLILRRGEFKTTGERNDKIRVVDALNLTWPDKALIGNETEADVKVQVVDWGPRKKAGIYPLAVRVLELVAYEPKEFDDLPEDDPHVQAARDRDAEFRKDFGLGDEEEDVPDEAPAVEIPEEGGIVGDETDVELDDEVPV